MSELEFFDAQDELPWEGIADAGDSYRKYDVHEGIVFCIELSERMFQSVAELNYKSELLEILQSISELMSQLVITRPNTAIGCYLSNCSNAEINGYIYELLPLRDINAHDMKLMSDLLEDISTGRTTLVERFPFDDSKTTKLESLFLSIQDQFSKDIPNQKVFNNKKVFLFTDNDHPQESTDKNARSRLRRLVDDLNDNFINLTTFFVGSKEKPFNNAFYADILKLGASTSAFQDNPFDGPNTTPILASDIKSRILRKQEIKRVMFQCSLTLSESENFIVSLKGYAIISQEKPGTRYKLVYEHENVRKEAYSRRRYLNTSTGEEVTSNITKVYPYGELNIELSEIELNKISESYMDENAFLKLIGFRSRAKSLQYYNNIGKAAFVTPDETHIEGSIKALSSLFRVLKKLDRVAVVWGKVKSNSIPALYVLSPSEDIDPNEGFYLYRIPFLDEVRKFPPLAFYDDHYLEGIEYENMKRITENILGYFNLKKGYNPSEFRNPALQQHFRVLHDYVLQSEQKVDEKAPGDYEQDLLANDDTLRKVAQIRNKIIESSNSTEQHKQRLSKYIKMWNSYYNMAYNESAKLGGVPSSKRIKKEEH